MNECRYCYFRTWGGITRLEQHIQLDHPANYFSEICCRCGLIFDSFAGLLLHIETVPHDENGRPMRVDGAVVVGVLEGLVGSTADLLPELDRQPRPFRLKFIKHLMELDWRSRGPFFNGEQRFPPAVVDTRHRYPQLLLRSAIEGPDCFPRPTLFPIETTKTVHFIRSAEALHNSAGQSRPNLYLSGNFHDPWLTDRGHAQVARLRIDIIEKGIFERTKLVVVSPLLRALQTAVGLFNGEGCPPILATELCREQTGVYPCDCRRSFMAYQDQFAHVNFPLTEHDKLWDAHIREPIEELSLRGKLLIEWLMTRQEKEIAVVTHGNFLFHTLNQFGEDCDKNIKFDIRKNFRHGELRSVVIVDRSKRTSNRLICPGNGQN